MNDHTQNSYSQEGMPEHVGGFGALGWWLRAYDAYGSAPFFFVICSMTHRIMTFASMPTYFRLAQIDAHSVKPAIHLLDCSVYEMAL
jgi:hypothetical protein